MEILSEETKELLWRDDASHHTSEMLNPLSDCVCASIHMYKVSCTVWDFCSYYYYYYYYYKLQWHLKDWNQKVFLVEQALLYYNTNVVEFNATAVQMYITINVSFYTTVYLELLPQPSYKHVYTNAKCSQTTVPANNKDISVKNSTTEVWKMCGLFYKDVLPFSGSAKWMRSSHKLTDWSNMQENNQSSSFNHYSSQGKEGIWKLISYPGTRIGHNFHRGRAP